jgi:uncharacterized membrane protein
MVFERMLDWAGAAIAGAVGKEPTERVLRAMQSRTPIARDIAHEVEGRATIGDRMADRVAKIGGSWGFVSGFGVFLVAWAGLNALALPASEQFDPYPFIFLNLLLSMLAAIQAPIIMMSQNRQASKDRIESHYDYEVNLRAELEILSLHEKLDRLHQEHGAQLAALRQLLETPAAV